MSQNTVLKRSVCLFYFDEFFFYTDVYLILMVKHLPTMRETWVWSLGQEDPLEEEMATRSSNLDWKIPWTEEPGRLQSMASQRVGHDWTIFFIFDLLYYFQMHNIVIQNFIDYTSFKVIM